MRVYRGPSTKPFWDSTHELVSSVSPEKIESSIRDGSIITFNISKDAASERQAVCTAHFESEDFVPMINGLMAKLKSQQTAFLEIKSVMKNKELGASEKLQKIHEAISDL